MANQRSQGAEENEQIGRRGIDDEITNTADEDVDEEDDIDDDEDDSIEDLQ